MSQNAVEVVVGWCDIEIELSLSSLLCVHCCVLSIEVLYFCLKQLSFSVAAGPQNHGRCYRGGGEGGRVATAPVPLLLPPPRCSRRNVGFGSTRSLVDILSTHSDFACPLCTGPCPHVASNFKFLAPPCALRKTRRFFGLLSSPG